MSLGFVFEISPRLISSPRFNPLLSRSLSKKDVVPAVIVYGEEATFAHFVHHIQFQ